MKDLGFLRKMSNFCQSLSEVATVQSDVNGVIEEMKELTKEGEESKAFNFSERNRSYLRRLNRHLSNFSGLLEDAKVASDDIYRSVPKEFSKLSRLSKVLAKNFAETLDLFEKFEEKAHEAVESAMDGESLPKTASVTNGSTTELEEKTDKTNKPASVNNEATPQTLESDATLNKTETVVNFSAKEFSKSMIAEVIKRYVAFSEALEDAGYQMEDVAQEAGEIADSEIKDPVVVEETKTEGEPEIKTESTETATVETPSEVTEVTTEGETKTEETPAVTEEKKEEFCGDKNFGEGGMLREVADKVDAAKEAAGNLTKAGVGMAVPLVARGAFKGFADEGAELSVEDVQSRIIEEGVKALESKNEIPTDQLSAAAEELDKVAPGAGEAAVTTIENFSVIYGKCFKKENKKVDFSLDEAKKVLHDSLDKIHANEQLDVEELSNKLEGLKEANPGVYEVIVDAVESEADRNTPKVFKALTNFSKSLSDIKDFVADIPVADKDAGKCFCEKISNVDKAVAEIMGSKSKNFSDFVDSIKEVMNFSIEGESDQAIIDGVKNDIKATADDVIGALEDKYNEGLAVVPAQDIVESDNEINSLVDKIRESTKLSSTAKNFSTIVCDSIKSIKCFSESDIDNKLSLLEHFSELDTPTATEEENKPAEEVSTEVPEEVEDLVPPSELAPNMDVEDEVLPEKVEVANEETKTEETPATESTEVKTEVCPVCGKSPCECQVVEEKKEVTPPSDEEVVIKNFSTKSESQTYGDFIFSIA